MKLHFYLSLIFLFLTAGFLPLSANDEWRVAELPVEANFQSVTFGNGVFVAAGESSIVHSTDGVDWTDSGYGEGVFLNQVIFEDGLFVAVGHNSDGSGRILTSINGEWWDPAFSGATGGEATGPSLLRSVAYRNGTWVAVGVRGWVVRSDDAVSWEKVDVESAENLTSVIATPTGFLAFADGWILESEDGSAWTAEESDSGLVAQTISAEDRIWGRYQNGETWISRDGRVRVEVSSRIFTGISYAGDLFVGAHAGGFRLSAELADWADVATDLPGRVRAVTDNGEKLVAVGDEGAIFVRDVLWSPEMTVQPTRERNLYPVGGRLSLEGFAIGSGSALEYQWYRDAEAIPGQTERRLEVGDLAVEDGGVYTVEVLGEFGSVTSEGVEIVVASHLVARGDPWTSFGSVPVVPEKVVFGNGRFVAFTRFPSLVYHSRDGVAWEVGEITGLRFQTLAFDGGKFVAGGSGLGGGRIAVSPDGVVWEKAALPEGQIGLVSAIAWGNGVYVAAGFDGILWSEDGLRWERGVASGRFREVAFGEGHFLAGGDDGLWRSDDGQDWELIALPEGAIEGNQLGFHGDRWWVLVPALQSMDGMQWLPVDELNGSALFSDMLDIDGIFMTSLTESAEVWYGNGADWGEESAPFKISQLAAGNGRIVAVGAGESAVRSMEIEPVITVDPQFVGAPETGAVTYSAGANLTLRAGAVGQGELEFQWLKDGQPLAGETASALTLDSLDAGDAGEYAVEVVNAHGKTVSSDADLRVIPTSRPTLTSTEAVGALQSVAYGNGRFVGVGWGQNWTRIVHSSDGLAWSGGELWAVNLFTPVIFAEGRFLIGGAMRGEPVILTSTDGAAWRIASLPDGLSGPIFSIAYGDGIYVAGSVNGILRSTDGEHWENVADGPEVQARSIAFGNGFFMGAFGGRLYRSEDGIESEFLQAIQATSSGEDLRFAGGRWWLLGSGSSSIYGAPLQSLDGLRWVEADLPRVEDVLSVDDVFLAASLGSSANDGAIYYGSEGVDWGTEKVGVRMRGLTAGNGLVVGATDEGVFVRNAGIPPSIQAQPTLHGPTLTTAGGRLEMRVRAGGSEPLTYQWKRYGQDLPGQNGPDLVIEELDSSDAGLYTVVVSNSYGLVLSDEVRITVASTDPGFPDPVASPWRPVAGWQFGQADVVFGKDRFVVFGEGGLRYSRDGYSWRGGSVEGMDIRMMAEGGGTFVAGGSQAAIFYSEDGAAWGTAEVSGPGFEVMNALTWGEGIFVAATSGVPHWSPDGRNWEPAGSGSPQIRLVTFGNGFFLGILGKQVFRSADGREWVLHGELPQAVQDGRLTYAKDHFFLARGDQHSLLQSLDGATWNEVGISGVSDVLLSGSVLVAAGGSHIYYATADGAHWASEGVAFNPTSLARGNGRLIGAGSSIGVRGPVVEPYVAARTEPFVFSAGETAKLPVTPIGEGPFEFSWFRERLDNLVECLQCDTEGPVLEIENVSWEDAGQYRVRVTNPFGTVYSDWMTLTVLSPPVVVQGSGGTVYANPGATVWFGFALRGTSPITIQWEKDDTVLDAFRSLLALENVRAADAGIYRLRASNALGSITSDPIDLRVILSYDDWTERQLAAGALDPEQLDPEADPAGAGVPNLLRYALNLVTIRAPTFRK